MHTHFPIQENNNFTVGMSEGFYVFVPPLLTEQQRHKDHRLRK